MTRRQWTRAISPAAAEARRITIEAEARERERLGREARIREELGRQPVPKHPVFDRLRARLAALPRF